MSEGSLPSNVHVLKPRMTSLADRLDEFLEKHSLSTNEAPVRCDPTRPKAPGINAINCASCGQAEYLTRDYCRCGHYLRGQLEDEFLAWEEQVAEDHNQLLEGVATKLKRLRCLTALSLPFLVLPLLHLAVFSDGLSVFPIAWMAIGFAIMGLCAVVEERLNKPIENSQRFLASYTIGTFLEQRA